MDTSEDLLVKMDVIKTITDEQIKVPHHIPVNIYIQEAETLYQWVQQDKEVLVAAGLSWSVVEDIPNRTEALSQAEALWQAQLKNPEAVTNWLKNAPCAYELRQQMTDAFRFAFRNAPALLSKAKSLGTRKRHAGMIQGLNDLSVLGKENQALLEAIHFDISLLDQAAEISVAMSKALAQATKERKEYNESKKFRDQAYTHLKSAVDEVYVYGRFLFKRNKERYYGYRSYYIRHKKNRSKTTPATKEMPATQKMFSSVKGNAVMPFQMPG